MKRWILFGGLGICLVFFYSRFLEPSDLSQDQKIRIEKKLSLLSAEEQRDLRSLFEHFFFFDGFAYTLFGSKPMSIGYLPPPHNFKNGWNAWKKIAPSFRSENFVLSEHTFNHHRFILIANRATLEKTYHANKDLFAHNFDNQMSFSILVSCLKQEHPLFQDLIRDHLILGLLLGYGHRNSQLFADNETLPKEQRVPLYPFTKTHPIFYSFSPTTPLYFSCDPSSRETRELQTRYKKERATINTLARKDALFTRMLTLLE